MNKLWIFFNSQMGMLLLGFLFTSIFGTLITDRIQENAREKEFAIEKERQESSWKRDKRYEILKRKLDDGDKLIEQLSNLINTRFFQMQNVYVNLASNNIPAAKENWKKYYMAVEEWNIKLPLYQNLVKRLISQEYADKLNNYETDNSSLTNPYSIHGKFYLVHKKLNELLNSNLNHNSSEYISLKQEVNDLLRDLDLASDSYIDNLSDQYLKSTLNFETSIDSLLSKNNPDNGK